jgi:hypothetical protein
MNEEFDQVMARSGVRVPQDRYAGTLAAYRELMALTAVIRESGLVPADEPSAVYRVPGGEAR